MKSATRKTLITCALLFLALRALGGLDEGMAALRAQDYTKAREEFLVLANQGNVKAQYLLGVMHDSGHGGPKDVQQAALWYRKAAEQGFANAQFNLGAMYATGQGVPKSDSQAVAWHQKAADQGLANAQFSLGAMYAAGRGVPKDTRKAVAWYRKAAEQGFEDAQFNLGLLYAEGQGVPKDDRQAFHWYEMAAKQGNANAQNNLGAMYADGQGVRQSNEEAVVWYRQAAEQGLVNAQFNLGLMYAGGQGVIKDDEEAVIWYRKAAEQGLVNAQFNLGLLYAAGQGVPRDDKKAFAWYRKAAESGLPIAQFNLAQAFAAGQGVPRDDGKALAWYRSAAEQHNADAQFSLGKAYEDALGVAKDSAQAVLWYRKAAQQGHANAQFKLGAMYAVGQVVPKDDQKALGWYLKAAEQGHADAQFSIGAIYAAGTGVPKDEQTAFSWYRKAAEQGHAQAQLVVDNMYATGQGIPQDELQTHSWKALASAPADDDAPLDPASIDLVPIIEQQLATPHVDPQSWTAGSEESADLHDTQQVASGQALTEDKLPEQPSALVSEKADNSAQQNAERVEPTPIVEQPPSAQLDTRPWVAGSGKTDDLPNASTQASLEAAPAAPIVEPPAATTPQASAEPEVAAADELGNPPDAGKPAFGQGAPEDKLPAEPTSLAAEKEDGRAQHSSAHVVPPPIVEQAAPQVHRDTRPWVAGPGKTDDLPNTNKPASSQRASDDGLPTQPAALTAEKEDASTQPSLEATPAVPVVEPPTATTPQASAEPEFAAAGKLGDLPEDKLPAQPTLLATEDADAERSPEHVVPPPIVEQAAPPVQLDTRPWVAGAGGAGNTPNTENPASGQRVRNEELPTQSTMLAAEKEDSSARPSAEPAEPAAISGQLASTPLDTRPWVAAARESIGPRQAENPASGQGVPDDKLRAQREALVVEAEGNNAQRRPERVEPLPTVEEPTAPVQIDSRPWVARTGELGDRHSTNQPMTTANKEPTHPMLPGVPARVGDGLHIGDQTFVARLRVVQGCARISVAGASATRLTSDSSNDLVLLTTNREKNARNGPADTAAGAEMPALGSPHALGTADDDMLNEPNPGAYRAVADTLNAASATGSGTHSSETVITADIVRKFLDAHGATFKSLPAEAAADTVAVWVSALTVPVECWQ